MDNLMTTTMNKLTEMLTRTDDKLKSFGTMPYGERKATPEEKRQAFQNLTTQDVIRMLQEHGRAETNKYLGQFMGE